MADHFHVVVQVPIGWKQEPPGQSETQMLALEAPSNYSNGPARIALLSFIGDFTSNSWTPEQVAQQWYGPAPSGGHPEFEAQLVGQVMTCHVGADPAAFFQYTAQRSQMITGEPGDWSGYLVVFIHLHLAYGFRIEGTGGLDARAIYDAKAILGSWTWTVSPSPS